MDRRQLAELFALDDNYRRRYELVFGVLPPRLDELGVNTVFANIGKAIAAFERTLLPVDARFDRYVYALLDGEPANQFLSADEARGLELFIGDANCTQCHNGPLLTNHEFHNTGVINAPGELPDAGTRCRCARCARKRVQLSWRFQ